MGQYVRAPSMQMITSSLSLARELWRFGEPDLAEQALHLNPVDVGDVGARAGELYLTGEQTVLWPNGPSDRALPLAVVERLEGQPRPCVRSRRLPERSLPGHLQANEEERLAATLPVAAVVDRRNAGGEQHA